MVICTFLRVSRGNQEGVVVVVVVLVVVLGSGVGYVKKLDTYGINSKFNYGTNAAGQFVLVLFGA